MSGEKAHVDSLFEKYSGDNQDLAARAISAIISQALTGKHIHELLQNADDAKHKETKIGATVVNFVLEDDYLIFQHNGRHFLEKDVNGLCDFGNPDRDKVHDPDAIGNKGAGFKAIFAISDTVHVSSQEYNFRFDKYHSKWKAAPQKVPWPVVPIWQKTAELPPVAQAYLRDDLVTFVIKIKDDHMDNVKNSLRAVLSNNFSIILFLRCVAELNITIDSKKSTITKTIQKKAGDFSSVQLTLNASKTVNWIVYDYQYQIDKNVQTILQSDDKVVDKYKTMPAVTMQLAVAIDGQQNSAGSSAVFCYLPTDVDSNFPFLVNTEFFLDLARKKFGEQPSAVAWNSMLLASVYERQFVLLSHLAHNGHWKNVLRYIAFPKNNQLFLNSNVKFSEKIKAKFDQGKVAHKFVAGLDGEIHELTKVKYDRSVFINSIEYKKLYDSVANDKLSDSDILTELGVDYFSYDDAIATIKTAELRQHVLVKKNNVLLLNWVAWLVVTVKQNNNSECIKIVKELKDVKFILSDNKELLAPGKAMFCTNEFSYLTDEYAIPNLIHPDLNTDQFKKLFDEWNIKPFNIVEVIKFANDNEESLVEITQKIFSKAMEMQGEDRTNYIKRFSGLKLKTAKKYVTSTDCYLPDSLNPEFSLGFVYSGHIDVDAYFDTTQEDLALNWREFFIALGVQQTLVPINIESIVSAANKNAVKEIHIAFIRRLKAKIYKPEEENPLLSNFKKLNVLTETDEYVNIAAKDIYLADCYHPTMPLQAHVTELHYISHEYIVDEDDSVLAWKKFFLCFDLAEKIKFDLRNLKNFGTIPANSLEWQYINWLSANHDPYPANTARYQSYQHYIDNYYGINYFNIIKKLPLFWQLVVGEWASIKENINDAQYRTQTADRPIPSSIYFFMEKAAQEQYQCKLTELYSPDIKDALTEEFGLRYFQPGCELTDEHIQAFKLKTWLSFQDAISIIRQLGERSPKNHKTQQQIKTVYKYLVGGQDAVDVVENVPAADMGNLQLLNEKEEFVLASELFVLTTDEIKLKPNKKFLKRFNEISMEDYKVICEKLQIKPAQLNIASDASQVDKTWTQKIRDKIPLLCLLEAAKRDITEDKFTEFSQKFVHDFLAKPLVIAKCQNIIVTGTINDGVKQWIHCQEATFHYVGNCDYFMLADYFSQIARIYGWNMTSQDFSKVIGRSEELVCEEFNFNKDRISEINMLIIQHQTENVVITENVGAVAPAAAVTVQRLPETDNSSGEFVAAVNPSPAVQFTITQRPELQLSQLSLEDKNNNNNNNKSIALIHDAETSKLSNNNVNNMSAISEKVYKRSNEDNDNNNAEPSSGFRPGKILRGSSSDSSSSSQTNVQPPLRLALPAATQRQADADDTGKQGEAYFLTYLKDYYTKKHPDYKYTETPLGFVLEIADIKKEIIWINKNGEQYKSYDYIIKTTRGNQVKERLVDVKSSKSNSFDDFKLNYSFDEWDDIKKSNTSQKNETGNSPFSPYYFYYIGNLTAQPFVKKAKISAQFGHMEANHKLVVKDMITGENDDASAKVKDVKQITIKIPKK